MQTPKEVPDSMRELVEFYGEPISVYTMAQGIADGTLVEAGDMGSELFSWPVLLTAAAWTDCVAWSEQDSKRTGAYGQSKEGRLWDVLWMTFCAIKGTRPGADSDEIAVELYRVPRDGDFDEEPEAELTRLGAKVAAHDDGSPVLIIGLPGQD